jgi:large subunit ribosomal protein L25
MAGERIRLEVQDRDGHGSSASRRLRGRALIPGVLYGSGKDAQSFCVSERELRRVLAGEHGRHTILDVVLEGQQRAHHAVLKDFQVDPLRSKLLHIDLQEVRLDQLIQSQVVVELVGIPEGVVQGGVLSQVAREVNVEALPMEVPDRLQLDVSGMLIGDSLRLADLSAPEGVKLLDDEELVLATVTPPTKVEEPEEEEEEAEEEGEEAAAEGEEAPEDAAAQGADGESETSGE